MDSFFLNDTATTEIYPLSLHDALPIFSGRAGSDPRLHRSALSRQRARRAVLAGLQKHEHSGFARASHRPVQTTDWKSTRLNSSHANISYAVFCLKKKNKTEIVHLIAEK